VKDRCLKFLKPLLSLLTKGESWYIIEFNQDLSLRSRWQIVV